MSKLTLWQNFGLAIDRRFLAKVKAIPVPGSEDQLLLICFHPYLGKQALEIPEQVTIMPGDLICEIHISNRRIMEIAAEHSVRPLEWRICEVLKREFQKLAEAVTGNTIPSDCKAIYGVNTMGSVAKRFGFTLIEIPKGWNRVWLGFWESLLRWIFYSYKADKKGAFNRMTDPREIWMSREELIRRYIARTPRANA